ncbi:NUDIX domain-containing protein [Aliamphritea spongicola]|nr:NUDIX domain-containing protein [Aliamphritea spongicola]
MRALPVEISLFSVNYCTGDAVCVLLFDPQSREVALIEQFRVGAVDKSPSPWLLELVAGMVEPGETAQDVAIREAVEEAGAIIKDLVPITRYSPSVGGCDEYVDLLCQSRCRCTWRSSRAGSRRRRY